MTLIKCFTVLVASGNGGRCTKLRNVIRNSLLLDDLETGESKLHIHKFGKNNNSDAYNRVCNEVAINISPLLSDIKKHFFCSEITQNIRFNLNKWYINTPIILNDKNQKHVLVFRKTLEAYMSSGLWNGLVAKS